MEIKRIWNIQLSWIADDVVWESSELPKTSFKQKRNFYRKETGKQLQKQFLITRVILLFLAIRDLACFLKRKIAVLCQSHSTFGSIILFRFVLEVVFVSKEFYASIVSFSQIVDGFWYSHNVIFVVGPWFNSRRKAEFIFIKTTSFIFCLLNFNA